MRCLALADELRTRGANCLFVCRQLEGNLIEHIRSEGFCCRVLTKPRQIDCFLDEAPVHHSHWLEVSWQTDAAETIDFLEDASIDWLIVDHYALDARWEKMLRPHVCWMMAIDDLADRFHDCDLLLDQNLISGRSEQYKQKLPDGCKTLLGPQYSLLRPNFRELRACVSPRIAPIRNILAYFGASDSYNLTGRAVSAFLKLRRSDIKFTVVLNSNCLFVNEVREMVKFQKNIRLLNGVPSLAPLMLQADLAIGASGTTSWERCCLGLPSLVISVADNQKPIAAELHRHQLVCWLGHYDDVTETVISDALRDVLATQDLEEWSRACMEVTDGEGSRRVAEALYCPEMLVEV